MVFFIIILRAMFGYWGFLNIAEGNWLGELANIARETIERRLLKFPCKSATGAAMAFHENYRFENWRGRLVSLGVSLYRPPK